MSAFLPTQTQGWNVGFGEAAAGSMMGSWWPGLTSTARDSGAQSADVPLMRPPL